MPAAAVPAADAEAGAAAVELAWAEIPGALQVAGYLELAWGVAVSCDAPAAAAAVGEQTGVGAGVGTVGPKAAYTHQVLC